MSSQLKWYTNLQFLLVCCQEEVGNKALSGDHVLSGVRLICLGKMLEVGLRSFFLPCGQ